MVGSRRFGIGAFLFLSTAALAAGCSGGGGGSKDHKPVANDDTATTSENTAVDIDVLANDTDADKFDVLTIENVGTPGHGTAVIDNGKVHYTPNANYFGTDTFSYTISDGRTFVPPAGANVSVTITHVNQAPVAVADTGTTLEDTAIDVDVLANDTDPDAGDTLTITAVGTPAHGVATIASNKLHYVPATHFSGDDAVTYTVSDGNGGSAIGSVALTVALVNHAPSFVKGPDVTVPEDSTAYSAAWATSILAGPPNESAQTVSFTVTNDANGLFATQPAIDGAGILSFTPGANVSGTANVTVTAHDDGGTSNGGVNASASQTFTITVAFVNDAPSFTKGANQVALEDAGAQSVAGWATGISAGPANESAQAVSFVVSSDAPTLFSAGPSVAADGTLTYTPAPDANGVATVSVSAHDDGGTANGGADTSAAQTFTITLTPVNDAPSFTSGGDVTVAEDSGAYVNAWATGVSAGPANESSQHLSFVVTGDTNAAMFSLPPAVTPGGVLSFESAPNANGTSTITLHLADDGGTANGGVDHTGDVTFTIHVTAVDDPPVANDDGVATTENAALTLSPSTLTANDTDVDGPSISVDLASVTQPAHGAVAIVGGNVVYTPATNFHGSDSFTYRDSDGTLFSPFATVRVDVAVHDLAPSFTAGADVRVAENSGAYSSPSPWASAISQGAGESGQALTFDTLASNPSLFSSAPVIDATGHLTFTPAAGASGSSSVTVTLTDDDGSPSDATDDATSAPQVFTITVAPVPSFDVAGDQLYTQGSGTHVVSGFASNIVATGTYSFELYYDAGNLFQPPNCPPDCASPVGIDASGTLSVLLADGNQGQFGVAHLTAVLTDSTGAQTSRTFTIFVSYVNQPPTFNLNTTSLVVQDDDSSPHSDPGTASNLFPGANDEFNQQLSFTVTPDDPTVFTTPPSIDGTGNLQFTPNGTATPGEIVTLTVILHDDGRQPDGNPGTPAQSAPQFVTITFHDHTQTPAFVSSTPADGSFVNQQTSGFFSFGANELTPMKLFFDSPDLDCPSLGVAVTDLATSSTLSPLILCAGQSFNGVTVPDGQVWLAFNTFDSQPQGDPIEVDLTNITGVTSGGSGSATILFTYDDQPPQAKYIASQSDPFVPFGDGGSCAPTNTRAIFQFSEPIATVESAFTFSMQNFPSPATPVLADPAGEGFGDLDQADDLFYFVPNDLLATGNYAVTLGFTDVAGNPVQNGSLSLSICGSGGGQPPQEPAITRIAFREPGTNVDDAVITPADIANGAFLAPPSAGATSDDLVVTFDQNLDNGGSNGQLGSDGGGAGGGSGFFIGSSTSSASLVFQLTQQFPTPQFQDGGRYRLQLNPCSVGGGSCSNTDLVFYVQTTGASAPIADAFAARGARASDGSIPAVRPEEPWILGVTGQVDPRSLTSSAFTLMDGSGGTYPVTVEPLDTHLNAVAFAFRAVDASGRPIALPEGSYTFSESGLLDVNSPQNPIPAAAFALDVLPHPSIPHFSGLFPQDGERISGDMFGNPIVSIFATFDDLMSTGSFRDTGAVASRGFSLLQQFVGSQNHAHFIPLKGLSPGTIGCCGNDSQTIDDGQSTLQLAFVNTGFGTPPVGFEEASNFQQNVYRFTPLAGLEDLDDVALASSGSSFTFSLGSEFDGTAAPTIESFTLGGELLPDGTFTCSVCDSLPQTSLTAQIGYWDPTGNSTFSVVTSGGNLSTAIGGNQVGAQLVANGSQIGPGTMFPNGDDVVTLGVQDTNTTLSSEVSFDVHVPEPIPTPVGLVSTNGTLVTVQGQIAPQDGPFAARVEMTIVLTDDSTGTPDIQAFGPAALANVVRAANGLVTYSQTFDARTFPPKNFPTAAYHALVTVSYPDGLSRNFNGGGGGGRGANPGGIDVFCATPAIPAQGPPPPPPMIQGTLQDVMGNAPLAGGTVSVDGVTGNTSTSPSGAWALPMPTPGPTYWVRSTKAGYFDGLEPDTIAGPTTGLGPLTISDSEFQSFVLSAFLPSVDLTSGDVLVVTNNSLLQQSWVDIGTPSTLDGDVNGGGGNPIFLFENATPGDSTLTITPQGGANCVWNTRAGRPVFGPPYDSTPLRIGSHGFTVIEIDCN